MLKKLLEKYKWYRIMRSPSRMWSEAYSPLRNIPKEMEKATLNGSFIFREGKRTNEEMELEAKKEIEERKLHGWKLIDCERYIFEDTEIIGLIILVFEKK